MPAPFSSLSQFKIPHPGRVAGQAVMKLTMPAVLGWVLGGNVGNIEKSRHAQCRWAFPGVGSWWGRRGRVL